jgi:AcrR family transcriptional regulator
MPRYKKDQREQLRGETRRLLLDAATAEFARQGYAAANINRISRAAGFAKGTIYNYFSSKRALMLALIDEVAAAHVAFISEQVRQEQEPDRRLQRFFEAGFAFVADHLTQTRVIVTNLFGPDEPFKRHLGQAYGPLFQLVSREILAPGIAAGVFRPLDPDATAALLMTIYLGTGSQVDEAGRPYLAPQQVAAFVSHALRK